MPPISKRDRGLDIAYVPEELVFSLLESPNFGVRPSESDGKQRHSDLYEGRVLRPPQPKVLVSFLWMFLVLSRSFEVEQHAFHPES
jgi:hypothetical protein